MTKKNQLVFIIWFWVYCMFYSPFSKLQTTYSTIWEYINVVGKIRMTFFFREWFSPVNGVNFSVARHKKAKTHTQNLPQSFFNSQVHLPLHCTFIYCNFNNKPRQNAVLKLSSKRDTSENYCLYQYMLFPETTLLCDKSIHSSSEWKDYFSL